MSPLSEDDMPTLGGDVLCGIVAEWTAQHFGVAMNVVFNISNSAHQNSLLTLRTPFQQVYSKTAYWAVFVF